MVVRARSLQRAPQRSCNANASALGSCNMSAKYTSLSKEPAERFLSACSSLVAAYLADMLQESCAKPDALQLWAGASQVRWVVLGNPRCGAAGLAASGWRHTRYLSSTWPCARRSDRAKLGALARKLGFPQHAAIFVTTLLTARRVPQCCHLEQAWSGCTSTVVKQVAALWHAPCRQQCSDNKAGGKVHPGISRCTVEVHVMELQRL